MPEADFLLPRRNILFVDDEPFVLHGLRRSLRHLRHACDLDFAEGGPQALELMSQKAFDVIVSDMRMPGMDGVDLLTEVQRRHPRTVRIVLSGQSDQDQLVRCIGCAHRFLPKPCEPAELDAVLSQVTAIQDALTGDEYRRIVASLDRIPAVPELYLAIVDALRRPDVGLDAVAELIARDPGTTAGILKVVNSAYFSLRHRVADPYDAVRYLGLDMVRSLVLAVGAFRQFEDGSVEAAALDQVWHHSMETGAIAREIARTELAPVKIQDECFVAGMLHDIGKLVVADNLPQEWRRIDQTARERRISWHAAESQTLGVTHCDIGGGILGLWGLPGAIVDAVLFHHTPGVCSVEGMRPVLAVHCADVFAHERLASQECERPVLDLELLTRLGLERKVGAWRKAADSVGG